MLSRITILLEMIKFSHTLFALPFALIGMLTAARGLPGFWTIFWIVMAMVGARTMGMTLNRILDAEIDRRNPRTAERHIPAGVVSRREAWLLVAASFVLFEVAAWALNPLAFKLSFVAVGFLVLYPFMKRFSVAAHIVLGLTLAMAPIGATIAVAGEITLYSLLLGGFVLLWSAAFDIIYATQDIEFDRSQKLFSIPAWLGQRRALQVAALFHGVAFALLLLSSMLLEYLGGIYLAGVGVVGVMLVYEHLLAWRAKDPADIDRAFFTVNSYISIVIFVATCLDAIFFW
ncbi:putative 4-hydroxybenzoate polyprenyltransferase [Desulfurispirillum indicum]|uniref:4-hydroxybenzoate polyprenyltransferase n=1 Tax=Desulfurispirillum indicum (strain ATCC BAA-1389 / DSM 22839 / S5) TaxID=653733 RepID=E6W2S2_DESIS|nr:UbiA-like polyprenyltransferase [Desulfurispirillum indicum]ADU65656.1 4-hydroxybenzoate polyprenyltransferase [Desulfurispirillum indicum S5]UCZ57510.1 putative 4-hydroxybenzoate polyprenyltransferase [Desulfurispirillum indicum]